MSFEGLRSASQADSVTPTEIATVSRFDGAVKFVGIEARLKARQLLNDEVAVVSIEGHDPTVEEALLAEKGTKPHAPVVDHEPDLGLPPHVVKLSGQPEHDHLLLGLAASTGEIMESAPCALPQEVDAEGVG